MNRTGGVGQMPAAEFDLLGPYVPSLVVDWLRDDPGSRYRALDGTLVFADVSGFTRLTEMLARAGKIGAEEMAGIINALFEQLLSAAYEYGAGLIKYGGDAVLLLFDGDGHLQRACRAAANMQTVMRREGGLRTTRGPLRLRMSVGVHTGLLEFLLVGGRHLELIVTGPAATTISEMEKVAEPGQIVVSRATAQALADSGHRRPQVACQDGFLLGSPPPADPQWAPMGIEVSDLDLGITMCASLREHIRSGSIDHEHRRVTIGFVKFSGTDAVLARDGPATLTNAVARVMSAAQDAASANGVTMLGSDVYPDGGKLLMISGAPRQVGHDEDRMLATVRSVISSGGALPLRGGVNSGQAFTGNYGPPYRRTYSVIGDCVNLAARLMEHAPAGELLTTGNVIKRATGSFVITALPPFPVKGKSEPIQAFSVGHSVDRRDAVGSRDPLVGREAELEALIAASRAAAAGTGRVVEIVGPAGIGKSRLVAELRAVVVPDALQADGDIYATATPYAPFERLFRERLGLGDAPAPVVVADALRARCRERAPHLIPWLPLMAIVAGLDLPATPEVQRTDPETRKHRIEALTSEFLAAVLDGPQTLIFNDVHLMDDASANLISRLVADAARRPWLIVLTRRPGEDAEPARDGVTRLELQPLGPQVAEQLLAQIMAATPLPAYKLSVLVRRAGGNPLFLRELVARVAEGGDPEDLPESVEAAIAARIDRLPPHRRRMMRAAAVLGVMVDVEVLTEVLQEEVDNGGPATLDVLEELDILDELLEPVDATHRRFTHELVRTVAYEGLPFRRREVLHARAAAVMERIDAGETDQHADLLSLHCLHGARYESAWRYARVAARRARARYATADAAEFYRRALAAAPKVAGVDLAELAEVDEALGEVYYHLGELHAAETSLRRARRRAAEHPLTAAGVDMKLAKLRETAGQHDAALRWISRAVRTLDGDEHPGAAKLRARLMARRARIRYLQGRVRDAFSVASEAVTLAEHSSDLPALAEALEYADVAEVAMGVTNATGRSERALAIYAELGDLRGVARLSNTLGALAYFRGNWPDALEHYRAAEEVYERCGQSWAAATSMCNLAEVLIDQGCLDRAETKLEQAMQALRGVGVRSELAFAELQLGRLAARRGDTEEALRSMASARKFYAAAGETAEEINVDARIAEALVATGEHRAGLELADRARARTRTVGAGSTPLLERVRGIALLGLGRCSDGETALRESLAAARTRAAPHEISFALRAMLDAPFDVDVDERSAWREELARLEDQLGLVA